MLNQICLGLWGAFHKKIRKHIGSRVFHDYVNGVKDGTSESMNHKEEASDGNKI